MLKAILVMWICGLPVVGMLYGGGALYVRHKIPLWAAPIAALLSATWVMIVLGSAYPEFW